MKKRDVAKSQRQARTNVKARKAKARAISQAEAAKSIRRKARRLVGTNAAPRTAMGLIAMMLAQETRR